MNKTSLKIIIASSIIASSSAIAAPTEEGIAYRVDQDAISYIDANMMWANNCEFQLNQSVGRPSMKDGDFNGKDLDEWQSALGAFCDETFGFDAN